jgi:hypothetical protein
MTNDKNQITNSKKQTMPQKHKGTKFHKKDKQQTKKIIIKKNNPLPNYFFFNLAQKKTCFIFIFVY